MSAYERAKLARIKFKEEMDRRGWSETEIGEMLAGWDHVMDHTCDHANDRYDLTKMDGDGSDAAMDMADPFGSDREAVADMIYEGITKAREWITESFGGEE